MNILGLDRFLDENRLMALEPVTGDSLVTISGTMYFDLTYKGQPRIYPSYKLSISIPHNYPKEPPVFKEIGEAIPKKADFHVNETDGSLCLGSPLRLKMSLSQSGNFYSFCEDHLNPYIYAVSLKLSDGVDFIFGELEHGNEGEVQDYCEIFGVTEKQQVCDCLVALSKRKSQANKMNCPCGCRKKLCNCPLRLKINSIRKIESSDFFIRRHRKLCQ